MNFPCGTVVLFFTWFFLTGLVQHEKPAEIRGNPMVQAWFVRSYEYDLLEWVTSIDKSSEDSSVRRFKHRFWTDVFLNPMNRTITYGGFRVSVTRHDGVPPGKSSISNDGIFHEINQPANLGYPHDYGNPHIITFTLNWPQNLGLWSPYFWTAKKMRSDHVLWGCRKRTRKWTSPQKWWTCPSPGRKQRHWAKPFNNNFS